MTLPFHPSFFLFFAMVGALAGLFPPSLQAAPATCNEYRPAEIDVKPLYEEVQYDHTRPMLKIREMADAGQEGAHHETWPVGLAAGQIYLKVTNDIFKLRSPYDPTTCGQIKATHVEIGFTNNVIYIAKELPKRSCPYKTVLEHEERHKQVDRELLEEYTEKAKEFFAKGASDIGMMRHPAGAAIDMQVNEYMDDAIEHFSRELDGERKRRQKEVDSPEEYERVEKACDGQVMEIVRNRLELLEATYPGITKSVEKKPPPGEDTQP
jgi:hypothetical protein